MGRERSSRPILFFGNQLSSPVAMEKYLKLIATTVAQGILVFCPETHEPQNDLSVRVFVDCFGIPEDPATGSGNGCLAGYLVQHRYWGDTTIEARVEQGYDMGRPSLLHLKAAPDGDAIRVAVGGRAITVATGELSM